MADAQRHTFRDHDNVPGVCWRQIDGTNNICGRGPDDDVHQPVTDAQRPAAGGEQDGRFQPGALVMPDSNARVAHVILTLNGTGTWWYALCNRNGRTDGKFGDRSFITEPGTPLCARCKARLATTSEVTS